MNRFHSRGLTQSLVVLLVGCATSKPPPPPPEAPKKLTELLLAEGAQEAIAPCIRELNVLKKTPKGLVGFRYEVDLKGVVSKVELAKDTVQDKVLTECLLAGVKKWRYVVRGYNARVSVTQPILFQGESVELGEAAATELAADAANQSELNEQQVEQQALDQAEKKWLEQIRGRCAPSKGGGQVHFRYTLLPDGAAADIRLQKHNVDNAEAVGCAVDLMKSMILKQVKEPIERTAVLNLVRGAGGRKPNKAAFAGKRDAMLDCLRDDVLWPCGPDVKVCKAQVGFSFASNSEGMAEDLQVDRNDFRDGQLAECLTDVMHGVEIGEGVDGRAKGTLVFVRTEAAIKLNIQ